MYYVNYDAENKLFTLNILQSNSHYIRDFTSFKVANYARKSRPEKDGKRLHV